MAACVAKMNVWCVDVRIHIDSVCVLNEKKATTKKWLQRVTIFKSTKSSFFF